MTCTYHFNGEFSPLYTDIYNRIETGKASQANVLADLRKHKIVSIKEGAYYAFKGDDVSRALGHIKRITKKFPGLIDVKYIKEGNPNRPPNPTYAVEVNKVVLDNINATIEVYGNIETEESFTPAEDTTVSDQAILDNTSESRGVLNREKETKEGFTDKKRRLINNFKSVGITVSVEEDSNLPNNVSGNVTGNIDGTATIKVNPNYLLDDTIPHEFGHIYVDLLGVKHPLIVQALEQLKGSALEQAVINMYPELSGEALKKEIVATAIGVEGAKIFKKNPSKLQTIINKIFRAIGKILGLNPNAAAMLAEQMFAGDIQKSALVGIIDPLTRKSKSEDELARKVEDIKILLRNMRNIAKSKKSVKSEARVRVIEKTLGTVRQLEDFSEFITSVGYATSNIKIKFKEIENKIQNEEELTSKDAQTISDMNEYLRGFEILDGLSTLFQEESTQVNSEGEVIQQSDDFSTQYSKLKFIIAERNVLSKKYKEIGIPALVDMLLPHASEDIHTQIDAIKANIVKEKRAEAFVVKKDLRYIKLVEDLREKRIKKPQYDELVEKLTLKQLDERKSNRETLKSLLLSASKDDSAASYMIDPAIYSNDNAFQLFVKSVKAELVQVDDDTKDFMFKLDDEYESFTSGQSRNNVKTLNEQVTVTVRQRIVDPKTGKVTYINRVAYVQPYDVDSFYKNQEEATKKAKESSGHRDRWDFDTAGEYEEWHDFETLGGTSSKFLMEKRKTFNNIMGKWYSANTVPVDGADAVMRRHEKELADVASQKSDIQTKIDNGTSTPMDVETLSALEIEFNILQDWKSKNYNVVGYTLYAKGVLTRPSTGGMRFGSKLNDYTSKKYAEVQADPRKKRYYDFMMSTYKEHQSLLGNAGRRQFRNSWDEFSYMVPSDRKEDKDRLIEQGGVEVVKEFWGDGLSVQDTDIVYGDVGLQGIDGSPYKVIPIMYAQPIDEKDVNFDLAGSMIKFVHMAKSFKAKSDLSGEVSIMRDVLESRQTSLTNSSGVQIIDSVSKSLGYGRPLTIEGKDTNVYKHFESFVDNTFYNIKSIKKEFDFLGKTYEANKVAGAIVGYTARTALSMNLLQAANQSVLDNILTYAEAAAGQFMDRKSWAKGKQYYWRAGGAMSDLGKMTPRTLLGQMIWEYEPIQGDFMNSLGQNVTGTKAKKLFTSDALFFLQHGAEHELQVSRMLGMLEFIKAMDKDGKFIKNEDGTDMTLLDAHTQVNGRLSVDSRVANFNKMDFMNKVHGVNKRTNGVYNDFDKAHLKRLWGGKLGLLFRGWMAPGYRRRFGHGESWHVDQELGAMTQGTYITFWNMLKESLAEKALSYNKMTDLEKQNVKRVMVELNAFIGTLLVGALLAAMVDDDEEKGWTLTFLMYQNRRLQTELVAFTPIAGTGELIRLLESPTATIRPLQNMYKLVSSTVDNLVYFGSGGNLIDPKHIYYQKKYGRNLRGEYKWDNKFRKMVPMLKGMETSYNPNEPLKWLMK